MGYKKLKIYALFVQKWLSQFFKKQVWLNSELLSGLTPQDTLRNSKIRIRRQQVILIIKDKNVD